MNFICKTMSTSNISKRFVSLLIAIASLLTTAQAAAPAIPVLFVHGLNDVGSTWATMIKGLDASEDIPTVNTGARLKADINYGVGCYYQNSWSIWSESWTPLVAGSIPASKRYFAIDFSDNNGLDLDKQAKELKIVIDCVTQITNTSKVSLVAHSMGGLASRQYLQSTPGISRYSYAYDVENLITIGTPHNGVEFPSQVVSKTIFCAFVGFTLKRCSYHAGPHLVTDSLNYYGEINKLNRALFSLPTTVKYHSIVGKGVGYAKNLIVHGTDEGDTVVSLFSQTWMHANLARPPYLSSVFNTTIVDKVDCDLSVAHNCEPGFLPIIVDVARELGIPVYQVSISGKPILLSSITILNGAVYVYSAPFDTSNGNAILSASISGGIEWGTNGAFTNPPISTAISAGQYIPITAHIPTQAPGTVIQYRTFTIVNGVKTVGSTQTVTIPPSTTGNLPAPTSVSPPNGASSLDERPVFSWTSVASATSYRLMVALAEADLPTDPTVADCASCILNAIASDTTYNIAPSNTFVAGKTYYWRVKARSPTQYGNVSTAFRFALSAQALLPAPQLSLPLTGSSVNSSNTQLTWQAAAGATSYRVFVAQNSSVLPNDPAIADCDACVVNTTTSDPNFWLDPSLLLPGRTYYWMVKGRNAAQYGAYSEIRRFVVNQSQCSFAFAQTSLNTTAVSATYPLTLMTQPGCSAPATSNQAYCTVSPSPVTADSSGRAGLNLTIQTGGAAARACTVTVGNASLNVTQAANVPPSTWTLTLNQAAGGLATVSPNQTVFADGAQVVLTATPSVGYKFSGWQEGGSIVASPASFPFTIHNNRSFVPVFSSTQVTVTGLVSSSASPDQKWRVMGNAINTMVWQSNGDAINLQSGTSYRVDCADTPYYQPAVNTFNFTPGSSFTCSYSAKAQVPISPSLTLRAQPRLASGVWNSLAKLDDGRAVIWGLSQYTDFPNYSAISDPVGTPVLLKPLFLPYSTDVAGVSISPGTQNGMFTLSSTGTWKRWSNAASSSIRVPTAEPALNGFVRISGNLGLKSDNTLWFINQSGVNTQVTTLTNIVDIAGTFNSTSSPAIALRSDGAVISLTDPGTTLPCFVAGISSFGGPYSNCSPPVALPGINRVLSIAVASGNAYAVRDDGTVWVWNSYGTLTGGVTLDPNNYSPVQIPGITGAVQVVASSTYSKGVVYVRTSSGQVYAWGANDLGQLGRGTTTASEPTPQIISGLSNIVELGQTDGSSLVALDSIGFVWTVGVAYTVGNGSTAATQSTPVKVSCPNGYVGDLNLTAFSTNCVAASVNTLNLTGTVPAQVLVNGQVTALPMSQSFPANADVTIEVVPDIGYGFTGFHGDMWDWKSRIKSIPMIRDWNISVGAGNCANYPVNSTVVVNGSDLVPLTATASGGAQTVNVYGTSGISIDNCHWGFSTTDSWIHANADGFGPSSFVVNIEPNPTTVQRIGNFKLAGAASGNIRVTQAAAAIDTAPDTFSFPSYIGAPVSTLIESSAISLSGFNASAAISIANGEYSIGCNGTFASAAGTIDNTQTLCVRQTSASAFMTSTTTTIAIGGVTSAFVVTTQADTATPAVSLNPTSLTFTNQAVGTTSAAKTITLTNTGGAPLTVSNIVGNHSVYGLSHNCSSLASAASCTLNVTYSPTSAVSTLSSITITSNAPGSPNTVVLNGNGVPPAAPVCTLSASPTSVSTNGTSVLTPSCTTASTSYVWTGGTCAGTTAATCTVTPTATTTYTVAGVNAGGTGATASATVTVTTVGTLITRYRLYSDITKEHLYTTDTNEYSVLATRGWLAEGAIYRLYQGAGSLNGVAAVPFYRLYNRISLQHHWTTDANEYNVLGQGDWTREGIDGYILPSSAAGSIPVYRLYLNAFGGLHLWTTDLNEKNVLSTRGWVFEGVSGYVVPLQ